MPFTPPEEEEIRRRLGLTQREPIAIEQKDSLLDLVKMVGTTVKSVEEYFGVPAFLLTNAAGVAVAIWFLQYWGPKVVDEVKDAYVISQDYWKSRLPDLPKPDTSEPAKLYAIITPTPNTLAQNVAILQTGMFPTGTQVVLSSGVF